MTVTEVPDDFAADASTTGTVAVGGSATGEVERADDSDWFAVTLEAGQTYLVDLKGRDTGDGTLKDPYLHGIFDAAGRRVGITWDYDGGEGRNSRTTVAVEADGAYYVAAGASGREEGTYTVTVTEVPEDFVAAASLVGTVAVGGSATGEIERAGERDWFAVTLEAGKSYTVDLKGRTPAMARWRTRSSAGFSTKTAESSPIRGTTTAARGATAARPFLRRRAAHTTWKPSDTTLGPTSCRLQKMQCDPRGRLHAASQTSASAEAKARGGLVRLTGAVDDADQRDRETLPQDCA